MYQYDPGRTVATSSWIPEVGFANQTPLFTVNVFPFHSRRRSFSISPPTSLPALIMGRPPSSKPPPAADSVSTMLGASSTPSRVARRHGGSERPRRSSAVPELHLVPDRLSVGDVSRSCDYHHEPTEHGSRNR